VLRRLQDHTILLSIAEGDERAFSQLFYEYHQPLGQFVYSITRSRELTEEVIQDVFVKVWQNRGSLPAVQHFHAYLFITTRNHTLNVIRQQSLLKKKQQAANRFLMLEEEQAPEPSYDLILQQAVNHLPQQQKKVFLLKQQGLKNADVAVRLKISVNSVKKYQQWAVQ
jgi:RNA polymerase sigma factor (sigma-70 family)